MRVFLRLLLQTLVCSGQFKRVKKEYIILYYIIHTCYDSLMHGEKSLKKTVYNSDLALYMYVTQFRDNSWSRVFFLRSACFFFGSKGVWPSFVFVVYRAPMGRPPARLFSERIRIFLYFVLFFCYSSFLLVFFLFLPDAKIHADPIASRNCVRPLLSGIGFPVPFWWGLYRYTIIDT